MKITLCGSIAFIDEMLKVKKELEARGHIVKMPPTEIKDHNGKTVSVKTFYDIRKNEKDSESGVWGIMSENMRKHFAKVEESDAILVVNHDKNNIAGYIGANTLIEMGLAYYLRKKIFLLNDIPEISYKEEILGVKPQVIHGNFDKIR